MSNRPIAWVMNLIGMRRKRRPNMQTENYTQNKFHDTFRPGALGLVRYLYLFSISISRWGLIECAVTDICILRGKPGQLG